jgi:hypothetical protein
MKIIDFSLQPVTHIRVHSQYFRHCNCKRTARGSKKFLSKNKTRQMLMDHIYVYKFILLHDFEKFSCSWCDP